MSLSYLFGCISAAGAGWWFKTTPRSAGVGGPPRCLTFWECGENFLASYLIGLLSLSKHRSTGEESDHKPLLLISFSGSLLAVHSSCPSNSLHFPLVVIDAVVWSHSCSMHPRTPNVLTVRRLLDVFGFTLKSFFTVITSPTFCFYKIVERDL